MTDPSEANRERGADEPAIEVVLIGAVAANGVIGADGEMPWHHPVDLAHFKETTMGNPVILGRRTFESIVDQLGEPLPGRTNIVLSRTMTEVPGENVVVVDGVEAALDAAEATGASSVYVAGGGTVYEEFLDRADRLVLTELDAAHGGDTYFPAWPPGERWTERSREDRDELSFVVYE